MIDYIENPDKATKFVSDKLVEVKRILDEIAEETGIVYVAMPEEQVSFVAGVGTRWASWLIGAHKVVADRLDLSSRHASWMLQRHPDDQRKPQEKPKEKPKQKDLFQGTDDSPSSDEG